MAYSYCVSQVCAWAFLCNKNIGSSPPGVRWLPGKCVSGPLGTRGDGQRKRRPPGGEEPFSFGGDSYERQRYQGLCSRQRCVLDHARATESDRCSLGVRGAYSAGNGRDCLTCRSGLSRRTGRAGVIVGGLRDSVEQSSLCYACPRRNATQAAVVELLEAPVGWSGAKRWGVASARRLIAFPGGALRGS